MLPILSNEITQHPYGDAFGGIVPIMEQIDALLAHSPYHSLPHFCFLGVISGLSGIWSD